MHDNICFFLSIYLLQLNLKWLFGWINQKRESHLKTLKAEKKDILERIEHNETFKKTLTILAKYKEEPLGKNIIDSKLSKNIKVNNNKSLSSHCTHMYEREVDPELILPSMCPVDNQTQILESNNSYTSSRAQQAHPSKGVLDSLLNFIIGDNSKNRFAIICKQCFAHNGMVLCEEYEYTAFKCVFCGYLNLARKKRIKNPLSSSLEKNSSSSTSENENITNVDETTKEKFH